MKVKKVETKKQKRKKKKKKAPSLLLLLLLLLVGKAGLFSGTLKVTKIFSFSLLKCVLVLCR